MESHGEKSYGDGREKQRQSHDEEVEMVAQQRACSVGAGKSGEAEAEQ